MDPRRHRLGSSRLLLAATVVAALALGGAGAGLSAARQQTADLRVAWSKSPRTRTVEPGKAARYVFTVSNSGPDAATNVVGQVGIILEGAKLKTDVTSDGARCSYEDVVPGVAGFVNCPLGTIADDASKTMTLRIVANAATTRTGGAIYVATLSASADTFDPDDSNSLVVFLPDQAIQYSIPGKLGGGKASAKRIRARVLIAPIGSQDRSIQRYRRVEVFRAPPHATVELRGAGIAEVGRASSSGRLDSRRFVNRSLPVGSVFTVKVTKRGMVGDYLRIKVIAGGAALAGRECVPAGGGPPRNSCG